MSHNLDSFFSHFGKKVAYPTQGILAQAAQAKNVTLNATIGVALDDEKQLLTLESIEKYIGLPKKEYIGYAPMMGVPALREEWQQQIQTKNPSLQTEVSLPVSTLGISHALHIMGMLFLDPNDELFIPDLYWENYDLIFGTTFNVTLKTYPTFINGGFNVDGLRQVLEASSAKRKVVSLNFPNNPTGYTPSNSEYQEINAILQEQAEKGIRIVILLDDAYFGLVFDSKASKESFFSLAVKSHENILCVKMDGATKEHYAWGLRVGFVTFGQKGASRDDYLYLEQKAATMIRATTSMSTHLSQSLMLHVYKDPNFSEQAETNVQILQHRFNQMVEIIRQNPDYHSYFEMLPCNSGYFASFLLKQNIHSETLRKHLIEKYSVGIIALGPEHIRIAFSSVAKDKLIQLFHALKQACKDLSS